MNSDLNSPELNELIRLARGGDRAAMSQLVARYDGKLREISEVELPHQLNARINPSDVMQQTFLSAFQDIRNFKGVGEAELWAWLQEIHKRNVLDAIRVHTSQKRSVRRESPPGWQRDGIVEVEDSKALSPSHQIIHQEEVDRLLAAIDSLAPDQREAVRMRHLERLTLVEMADRFGRTPEATAGLLKRGIDNLRKYLSPRKLTDGEK